MTKKMKKISVLLSIVAIATFVPVVNVLIPHTTFADSTNLIPNPQLAPDPSNSAIPQGWLFGTNGTNDAAATYPVAGPDASTTAAAVTITSLTDGFGDWFTQSVPVTPGAQYHFSDAYLSNAPTIIEAQYQIASTSAPLYTDIATLPSSNGSWTTADATFIAPAGATSLVIFHLLNNVGSLSFANPSLVQSAAPVQTPATEAFPQGMVTLAFDDGTQTQYNTAFPILKAAGLPATFYIITSSMTKAARIGTTTKDINNSYMDASEVFALNAAGNEIGDHTVNHCDLVSATCPDAQVANSPDPLTTVQELNQASGTLHTMGTVPVDTVAYPYGRYNQAIENTIQQNGFIAARTVDRGFNLPNSDRYALKIQYVNASTTSDADFQNTVKPWIDSAIANKTWLVLLFHQIEPTSTIATTADPDATTPEMLQNIVDYLKQNNVMVKTLHDGTCMMDGMASDPRCAAVQYPSMPITPTPTSTPVTTSTITFPPASLATLVVANDVNDASFNKALAAKATLTLTQNGVAQSVANPTFGTITQLIPGQQYQLTASISGGHTVTYIGDCSGTAQPGKAYSCVMIIDDQD